MFACLHAPGLPDSSHALLVNCACGFSPRVEETGAETVVLDIDGLDRLLGPPESIADAILRRAAALGMQVNVAVAANPDAAVHAARGFPGITILPQGGEAGALAGLPVAMLEPPPEMAETLASWGIRCFRDLAALPEAGLSARLGADGVRLQKLARGLSDRPLVPAVPAEGFEASLELEHPVMLLEPLSFLLARLLGDVIEKLGAQGLATDELRLRMKLDWASQARDAGALILSRDREGAVVKSKAGHNIKYDANVCAPRATTPYGRGSASVSEPRPEELSKNPDAQAKPPAPPQQVLCFQRWGRRFRLPRPLAGDSLTAPEGAVSSVIYDALFQKIGSAPLEKEHARTLRLPFPMRSAKTFLKLLALDLESHPPPAPVIAISLAAVAVDPRVVQYGLFLPPAPEPEKLELTLGRITKLVGRDNVGAAELVETHRPGAFRLKPFVVPEPPKIKRPKISSASSSTAHCPLPTVHCPPPTASRFLALRVFRPPLRAEVEAHAGRPAQIAARGVRGTVVSLAGPWRSSGDWWTAGSWSRDEWDIALSDGSLYRIYRDRKEGVWFVEGLYD